MTSDIDTWDEFVESRRFEKATSIQGQLDTLAAQMNEIQTDTKRVADIIDQLQGDNAAVDYENANFDPMAEMPAEGMPAEAPMEEPVPEDVPEELPEGEDSMAGGIEDVTQPVEGPAAAEADDAALPEEMPPAEGDITDEELEALLNEAPAGAEDMGAPTEGIATDTEAQGEPDMGEAPVVADDMVGKIKTMISMTDDPEVLSGLADLLSTALSQTAAQPMESEDLEGEPIAKSDDGIADVEDAEKAESVTEVKQDDGPTPETASEPFAESADEPEDENKPEPEEAEDEPAPEAEIAVVETEPIEAPEEVCPEAEEIAEKVADAVEDIVEDVLNGETTEDISEDTESFEQTEDYDDLFEKAVATGEMPSFEDMFFEKRAVATGIDGMTDSSFEKISPQERAMFSQAYDQMAQEDQEKEDAMELFDDVPKGASEEVTAYVKSEDKPETCKEDEFQAETFTESEKPIMKSSMDAGKHIRSFQEMMADSQTMGFAKSVDRPDNIATSGGDVRRPELTPFRESADRAPLKIGSGVNMFDAMQSDWDKYFQWKNSQNF